jgi:hypothetical protein
MGLLDSYTGTLSSSDGQMTPAAQGLLAAGLGILAHNRGLTSGTQAVGMGGLEGLNAYAGAKQAQMQQQLQNAQLQQLGFGLQKNKMLLDMAQQYLGNGPQMATTPNPAADIGGAADGSAGAGSQGAPVQVASAAPSLGGAQTPLSGGAPVQSAPQGMAPQGGPFGNMPRPLVAYGLLNDPTALFTSAAKQFEPTDIQKQMTAAGIDPSGPIGRQILQQAIFKANYVPNEAYRGGGYVHNPQTGAMEQLPQVPEGYTAQKNAAGQWTVVPVQGGAAAITGTSSAKARGTAGYQLQQVWDPSANGGKGGYVQQTVANVADAAGGGGAGGAGGQPPPLPTIPSFTGDKTIAPGNSGVPLPAFPGAAAPAPAPRGGPMASEPPVGFKPATDASQSAPSKQMADAYGSMSTADSTYQASREALNDMMALAKGKGTSGAVAGFLPSGVSTRISPDAAKYEKAHATYVALQGKALGSGGTDAARATIDEAVPTYEKPQSAMISGITNQLNNLDLAHLKTQMLTPTYQQGDEKGFTQKSAAFDNVIKPSMMPAIAPVLQLSGAQQRAAVQSAVKSNPSLRPAFEMLFNNGMLK